MHVKRGRVKNTTLVIDEGEEEEEAKCPEPFFLWPHPWWKPVSFGSDQGSFRYRYISFPAPKIKR